MPTTPTNATVATRANRTAGLLKQVSDPTRLQVLMLLAEGDQNVGQLCVALGGLQQAAVSHQLQLLRIGGLVQAARSGKNMIYTLTPRGRALLAAAESLEA